VSQQHPKTPEIADVLVRRVIGQRLHCRPIQARSQLVPVGVIRVPVRQQASQAISYEK
jgi:hypothetical protein